MSNTGVELPFFSLEDHFKKNDAFKLKVTAPGLNSDSREINDPNHPEAMWEVMKAEEAILAKIGGSKPEWFALFPTGQYVENKAQQSAHFMISPKDNKFDSPANMSVDQIVPACEFALTFLEQPNTIIGYNINERNQKGQKPGPQSWSNWHIHHLLLAENLRETTLTTKNRASESITARDKLREPFYEKIEQVLASEMGERLKSLGAKIVDADHFREQTGFQTRGALNLELPRNTSARELAKLFQEIDGFYSELHSQFLNLFFLSPNQLALRPQDQIDQMADQLNLDPFVKKFASRVLPKMVTSLGESKNSIYKGPTYSLTCLKQDDKLCITLKPHFFKKGGVLETLGIQVDREYQDDPKLQVELEQIKQNAKDAVNQVLEKMHQVPQAA